MCTNWTPWTYWNFQHPTIKVETVCWSEKPLPIPSSPSSPRTSTPLPLTSTNYNIRQQINELRLRNSSPKLSLRNITPPVKPNPRDVKYKSTGGSPAMSNFSSINNFSSRHFLNQERHRGGIVLKVSLIVHYVYSLACFVLCV